MADKNDTKRENLSDFDENPEKDEKELEDILGKITETSERGETSRQTTEGSEESEEIIRHPKGLDDQPEDLEGIIEKLSEAPQETPQERAGFFQRLLNWFKKS